MEQIRPMRELICSFRFKGMFLFFFIINSFVYFVRLKKVCLCSIHHYSK